MGRNAFHQRSVPQSLPRAERTKVRLLTFEEGSNKGVRVQCYMHSDEFLPQGWYERVERTLDNAPLLSRETLRAWCYDVRNSFCNRIAHAELVGFCMRCLRAVGMCSNAAELTAKLLVDTDAPGIHTHGPASLRRYARLMCDVGVDPDFLNARIYTHRTTVKGAILMAMTTMRDVQYYVDTTPLLNDPEALRQRAPKTVVFFLRACCPKATCSTCTSELTPTSAPGTFGLHRITI